MLSVVVCCCFALGGGAKTKAISSRFGFAFAPAFGRVVLVLVGTAEKPKAKALGYLDALGVMPSLRLGRAVSCFAAVLDAGLKPSSISKARTRDNCKFLRIAAE
jgi:hypothetical protein